MKLFYHHIGSPGNSDLADTIERKRSRTELLQKLPANSPERMHFSKTGSVAHAFGSKDFNCWGLPNGASAVFDRITVGDLVLFVHSAGLNGKIEYLGIVRLKLKDCWDSSPILWPRNPQTRVFPLLLFCARRKVLGLG